MDYPTKFECPISHCEFVNPLVISCGHTFDKESIMKLKKSICPLCNTDFDKNQCIPNWILIDHLNLNVTTEKKTIHSYDAIQARTEMSKMEINTKIFNDILRRIHKRSILGKSYLIYTFNKFGFTQRMINSLKCLLNNKGFYCTRREDFLWFAQLYISWN